MIQFETLEKEGQIFLSILLIVGVKIFLFFLCEGVKKTFYSSERRVQHFCHAILNSTAPYCWDINEQPLKRDLIKS